MAEGEAKSTDRSPPEVVPATDRYFFTNVFSMAFGDNDVIFHFAIDDRSGTRKTILPQASICMTPRSAKILAHVLAATIKSFEEANGPIPTPTEKLEKMQDSIEAQKPKRKKT